VPELPAVVMNKDPRFVQKMDKNTFLYLKELEYKVEDIGRQLDDLRVAYALLKADYEKLKKEKELRESLLRENGDID
jgi:hypothetical protein